jgi:hypothetical protein
MIEDGDGSGLKASVALPVKASQPVSVASDACGSRRGIDP